MNEDALEWAAARLPGSASYNSTPGKTQSAEFDAVCSVEQSMIRLGVRLPAGGSLTFVARMPA